VRRIRGGQWFQPAGAPRRLRCPLARRARAARGPNRAGAVKMIAWRPRTKSTKKWEGVSEARVSGTSEPGRPRPVCCGSRLHCDGRLQQRRCVITPRVPCVHPHGARTPRLAGVGVVVRCHQSGGFAARLMRGGWGAGVQPHQACGSGQPRTGGEESRKTGRRPVPLGHEKDPRWLAGLGGIEIEN